MLPTHGRGNDVLAVHAVHQAHDGGMGAGDGFDAVQCAGQCAVFQADDEKVGVMRLLRRPDRRAVDFAVDGTAILFRRSPRGPSATTPSSMSLRAENPR